jgi:hypothetical protein
MVSPLVGCALIVGSSRELGQPFASPILYRTAAFRRRSVEGAGIGTYKRI